MGNTETVDTLFIYSMINRMKKAVKKAVKKVTKKVTKKVAPKLKEHGLCLACDGKGLQDANTLYPVCKGSGLN